MFRDREHNISTGFTPTSKLRALNLTLADVQEGLRITLDLINQMSEICRDGSIDFLVLIIPTKESVYSNFIEHNSSLLKSQAINELLRNERLTNKTVRAFLENKHIPYVDVLGPLRDASMRKQLYPNNFGGHTNRNEYEIIANSIDSYLSGESKD